MAGKAPTDKTKDDREAKFLALLRRANETHELNRKAVYEEDKTKQTKRPSERQRARAEFELAKLEAEEAGKDFNKETAWDWTIEENEKWDEKQQIKKRNRERSQFSDYSLAAEMAYERAISKRQVNLDKYEEEKTKALTSKDLVSAENAYISAPGDDESTQHVSKEAMYRLMDSLSKQEERPSKRRKQSANDASGYINEKNKHFNEKLNKYAAKRSST